MSDSEKTEPTHAGQNSPQQGTKQASQSRGAISRSVSILLEFKRERAAGDRTTAREFVDRIGTADSELIVDLSFAEFLEEEQAGVAGVEERLCAEFPQFASELRRQIDFHRALGEVELPSAERETVTTRDSEPVLGESELIEPAAVPEIPGLKLIRQIGRGGMGVVYLAEQPALSRQVAVKFLLGGALASPEHRARFRAEAQMAASLRHPNIVQVHEVGEVNGQPYLVMEYVGGGTLDGLVRGERPQPREAAEFIRTLANALHEAHQLGILHRDLKPGNILLAREQSGVRPADASARFAQALSDYIPKITDFGLAKAQREGQGLSGPPLTVAGDILGTPSYMAPEQTQGDGYGPWTDVYSLGAILYELLAGRPPHLAATPWETLQSLMKDDPPALRRSIPLDLRTICHKCLSRRPSDRYSSMRLLADDLGRYLSGEPIQARRVSVLEKAWSWCQRNRTVATLGTAVVLTLLTLLGVSTASSVRLRGLLSDVEQGLQREAEGRQREADANLEARANLFDSFISEAKALQGTGRLGQRTESLAVTSKAIELAKMIGNSPERLAMVRDTLIASFSLTDMQRLRAWKGPALPNGTLVVRDEYFNKVAQLNGEKITVSEGGCGEKIYHEFSVAGARYLAMSNDGRWLAVIGESCQLFDLWPAKPELRAEFASRGFWGFTPDNNWLVGCEQDGVIVYDIYKLQIIHQLPKCAAEYPLAFASDNRKVAIANGDKIVIVDYVAGKTLNELPAGQAMPGNHCLAWHPDDVHLAAASYDERKIVIWDSQSGEEAHSYLHEGISFSIGFDEYGVNLLSCSEWDGTFNVFDVESEEKVFTMQGSTSSRIALHGNNIELLLESPGVPPSIWEFVPQSVFDKIPTDPRRQTPRVMLDIAPSNRWFAVATGDGLELYWTDYYQLVADLQIGSLFNGRVCFDEQGRLWAGQPSGWLRWTIEEKKLLAPELISTVGDYWPIDIDRQGNWTLTTNSWEVRLESLTEPGKLIPLGPHEDVRKASFSPDGKYVATGAWNGRDTKVWNVADGSLVTTLKTGALSLPRFSPDSRWLITSPDGGVVWKTGTWEEHLKLNSSLTVASGLVFAFSPDARWLVNSRSNCELQLWKTESKELLATLKDPSQMRFESVAISRDNFEIYTISRGKRGILSTWNLHALGSQVYERTGIDIFPEVDQHRDRALDDLELKNNERLEVVENELLLGLTAGKLNNDGNKLIDAGEWKQGLSMLERAAAKSPGNARILNSLSWNLLICPEDLRAPDKSLELAKKAVEIDGQAIYLNTLGTAQYRAGLYTEAVETLRRSLGDGSADAAAFDYWVLACCHAKLGEREQTEQMYRGGLAAEERVRGLVNEVWLREMKLFREEAEAAIGELKK
jgi:serine/threonine protein kinase/WD40 repeat protein